MWPDQGGRGGGGGRCASRVRSSGFGLDAARVQCMSERGGSLPKDAQRRLAAWDLASSLSWRQCSVSARGRGSPGPLHSEGAAGAQGFAAVS